MSFLTSLALDVDGEDREEGTFPFSGLLLDHVTIDNKLEKVILQLIQKQAWTSITLQGCYGSLDAILSNAPHHTSDLQLKGCHKDSLHSAFPLLGMGIRQSKTLKSLSFMYIDFTNPMMLAVTHGWGHIPDITLSSCTLASDLVKNSFLLGLQRHSNLRRLDVSRNSYESHFLQRILETLVDKQGSLKEISLQHNCARPSALDMVARLLSDPRCSLTTIDISFQHYYEAWSVRPILNALKVNRSLVQLDLSCNILIESELQELASLLSSPQHTNLQQVYLCTTAGAHQTESPNGRRMEPVCDETIRAMHAAARHNPNLFQLQVTVDTNNPNHVELQQELFYQCMENQLGLQQLVGMMYQEKQETFRSGCGEKKVDESEPSLLAWLGRVSDECQKSLECPYSRKASESTEFHTTLLYSMLQRAPMMLAHHTKKNHPSMDMERGW